MSERLLELSVTIMTSIRLAHNVDPVPTSSTYTSLIAVDSSTIHLQAVQTGEVPVAQHVWHFRNPTFGQLAKESSCDHGSKPTNLVAGFTTFNPEWLACAGAANERQ